MKRFTLATDDTCRRNQAWMEKQAQGEFVSHDEAQAALDCKDAVIQELQEQRDYWEKRCRKAEKRLAEII